MSDLTFTAIDKEGNEQIVTDLYWFEEEGIHEVIDGVGEGHNDTYRIVVQQIATLERQNELLRAVAEAARKYFLHTDDLDLRHKLRQAIIEAAIDGGALPSQWQQTTDKISDERRELWQQMADSDGGALGEE